MESDILIMIGNEYNACKKGAITWQGGREGEIEGGSELAGGGQTEGGRKESNTLRTNDS